MQPFDCTSWKIFSNSLVVNNIIWKVFILEAAKTWLEERSRWLAWRDLILLYDMIWLKGSSVCLHDRGHPLACHVCIHMDRWVIYSKNPGMTVLDIIFVHSALGSGLIQSNVKHCVFFMTFSIFISTGSSAIK